mgnify:CR=1 FL=1
MKYKEKQIILSLRRKVGSAKVKAIKVYQDYILDLGDEIYLHEQSESDEIN